jgi:mRNA-degrading endonuclease RelE of RelBE toxin-antitoxin system
MTPRNKPTAYLTSLAYDDLKRLPGNVRRQMVIAIDGLEINSRPPQSKILEIKDEPREIRRLRLGKWRIIYAIIEERPIVFGSPQTPAI